MTESLADYRARSHFDGLNGLRTGAIAMVVWHHVYEGTVHPLDRGFLGVDLFFVLSGFLISTLLLRERDATGGISLRRFWARRAARLFPPYYLLIGTLSAYYLFRSSQHSRDFFHTLPTDLLYLSNWVPSQGPNLGVLWSLATEQQFYLVWPLVELAGRRVAMPVILAFLALNQLVNFHLVGGGLQSSGLSILQVTYTPICLGVLLAHLLDSPRTYPAAARLLANRAALVGAAVLLALLYWLSPDDISGAPRLAIQLASTLLIGAVVMQPGSHVVRALEWRPIARAGLVSYGIYLFHSPVRTPVVALARRMELDSPLVLFVATFALTWGVAEVSFRLLEQPILAWSRRFRAGRRGRIAPLSAGPGL